MGLDMYLNAKRYLWSDDIATRNKVNEALGSPCPVATDENKFVIHPHITEVIIEVGYWRKANAIHQWFVTNVQDGKDECQESYVSPDKLQDLKRTCNKVLRKHSLAAELLPTQHGFFFGSYDYDEYYFQDLKDTVAIIDRVLRDFSGPEYTIYYQASW